MPWMKQVWTLQGTSIPKFGLAAIRSNSCPSRSRTSTHQLSSNTTFLVFWAWEVSRAGLPVGNCLNWSDFWHSHLVGEGQFSYRLCLKTALFGSFWTKMNLPSGKFTWPSALMWKVENQLSLLPSLGKLKILPVLSLLSFLGWRLLLQHEEHCYGYFTGFSPTVYDPERKNSG